MISSTHNHLNIAKDALLSTVTSYNESNNHVTSAQSGNQNLDSSESIPSEHSSIYEAALTSYESLNRLSDVEQRDGTGDNNLLGKDSPSSNSAGSHDTRPLSAPETIAEQRNALVLDYPILRKPVGSTSKPSQSTPSSMRRRGAFALDDIDAQILRRKIREKRCHPDSSSSSDTFERNISLSKKSSPVDPAQPILPPPVRASTPPGLPSFGSPEAMRYRTPSQPSHGRRSSSQSSQQPPLAGSQGMTDVGVGNNGNRTSSSRSGSLGRFLRSWAEPQPAPIAPGIVGRAEDGTLVRARFGTRQSGHGIGAGPGSRGLEAHPFHRSTLPVARTNEVVQVDGSPHSSRDEGQLSQPEAFAPPRHVRASSSSSHTSLPYPNAPPRPQLKPSPKINPRTSSSAGAPHITYRNSEPRLPRIIEMIPMSRSDNQSDTPTGQDSGSQGNNNTTTTPQLRPKETKTYWIRFYEACSSFCCGNVDEEEIINRETSTQVDGSGDVPGNVTGSRHGPPATGRGVGFGSRASGAANSPWIPAWGCQPGRMMGGDGVSEDW